MRSYLQCFAGSLRKRYAIRLGSSRNPSQIFTLHGICYTRICTHAKSTYHSLFCSHPEFTTCPSPTATATVTATPLCRRPTMDYPHFAVHRAYGSKRYDSLIGCTLRYHTIVGIIVDRITPSCVFSIRRMTKNRK